MPPSFQPGGKNVGGNSITHPQIPWPDGDYVFAGQIFSGSQDLFTIWQGVSGIAMRFMPQIGYGGVYCDSDTQPMCLQCYKEEEVVSFTGSGCPATSLMEADECGASVIIAPTAGCTPAIGSCPDATGPATAGNVQSPTIGSTSIGTTIENLGFTIAGGTLSDSAQYTFGFGASVGPYTFHGATWDPGSVSGGPAGDGGGGWIWFGYFTAPDGTDLIVAVMGYASGNTPLNWTLVMPGAQNLNAYIYAPAPASGSAGGCGSCSATAPPAPPAGLGAGPCYSISMDDVVTDICKRAGLTEFQIDTSLLTDGSNGGNIFPSNLVEGYVIQRPTPAKDVLTELMNAYLFGGCETSGVMRFVPRGLAPILTIPEDDLGLESDKYEAVESFQQEQDLPRTIQVTYIDPIYVYQQGKQQKQRNSRLIQTKQESVVNLDMVMDPDWAMQLAQKLVYLAWLEREGFSINLGRAIYLLLDPTDVIEFVYESLTFTIRLKENSLGQGLATGLKGVNENQNNYLATSQGGSPPAAPGGGQLPGGSTNGQSGLAPTWMELLDIPLLQDSDSNPSGTGKYGAFSSPQPSKWPGAQLYASTDDSTFSPEGAAADIPATYGTTTTVLGKPSAAPWTLLPDGTNTVTVQLTTGTLAGDVLANVEKGSNWFLIGDEIIGAVDVVQNMDGTWTLSNLLRGLRGTEQACGWLGDNNGGTNSHTAGELVIQLSAPGVPLGSAGTVRYADPLTILNLLVYYRGVTAGQDVTTATDDPFTITGEDLMPYAPIKVGGAFDVSNNMIITWQRRTRIGGDNWGNQQGSTFPLSESSELYDVEILNGSTVVRTISGLTTPTCVYLETQQVADFGSVQSSYTVNVYQRSAQVGRGFRGHGTVPAANGITPVYPGSGNFYVNGS